MMLIEGPCSVRVNVQYNSGFSFEQRFSTETGMWEVVHTWGVNIRLFAPSIIVIVKRLFLCWMVALPPSARDRSQACAFPSPSPS